jgi:molecular chaperone GrpE (heat shock protein)
MSRKNVIIIAFAAIMMPVLAVIFNLAFGVEIDEEEKNEKKTQTIEEYAAEYDKRVGTTAQEALDIQRKTIEKQVAEIKEKAEREKVMREKAAQDEYRQRERENKEYQKKRELEEKIKKFNSDLMDDLNKIPTTDKVSISNKGMSLIEEVGTLAKVGFKATLENRNESSVTVNVIFSMLDKEGFELNTETVYRTFLPKGGSIDLKESALVSKYVYDRTYSYQVTIKMN